jgi:hypothetical protein
MGWNHGVESWGGGVESWVAELWSRIAGWNQGENAWEKIQGIILWQFYIEESLGQNHRD